MNIEIEVIDRVSKITLIIFNLIDIFFKVVFIIAAIKYII